MSLQHGASFVKGGLVLHYDPANVKSYPGSGTVLTNLSGPVNATLVNGVALNTQFNKYFAFDGVNDGISTDAISVSTQFVTTSAWVRVASHGNFHNFVNNNWVNSGWILYSSATAWTFAVASAGAQYGASVLHNNSTSWTHLTGTYDGAIARLYVNGALAATINVANLALDVGVGIVIGGGTRPSTYDISQVMVYSRTLSPAEVRQNFEATRGRFNI